MTDATIYKLVLYPQYVNFIPNDWQQIKSSLSELGFIGESIQAQNESYFVGDNFLQLITFLGCSPQIQLTPETDNDDKFCRVVFSELSNAVQFRCHERDVSARCPKCRKKFDDWLIWLAEWQTSGRVSSGLCQSCQQDLSLFDLDWRHNAAFAACFIDVVNIYPQEALPTEELLAALSESTGQVWDYFFSD